MGPQARDLGFVVALFASCHAEHVDPPPEKLPYIGVDLPPSARNYQAHEQGGGHTRVQVRFEIDPDDLLLLDVRLPCRLGPVEVGPPKQALVVANDQPWYTPELVQQHRGCDHERGAESASFLVDVGDAKRLVVYAVIAFDWKNRE